jgi:glycosyltransferase involved in cell wall biosynthesis
MKISIITVCYNAQEHIANCIKSVIDQNYSHIEYIVIDGGSTDNTLNIIKDFASHISILISEKDKGIYYALNKGIALATGEYIGIMHADDFFADENVLNKVANAIKHNPIDILYGNLDYVDRIDTTKIVRKWRSENYKDNLLLKGWMPAHPTFYAKKTCFIKYGDYDTQFKSASDYDLMLRFLYKSSFKKFYLDIVMVKMRVGGTSNKSFKNRMIANREDYLALKKNGIPFPYFISIFKPFRKILQFFG